MYRRMAPYPQAPRLGPHEAFRTALIVAAEASTDVQFAPSNASTSALPSGGSTVDNLGIKGPVNSTKDVGIHDMAARYQHEQWRYLLW